jgi:hypothetical protein
MTTGLERQERIGQIVDAARSAFAAHAQGITEATLNQLDKVSEQAAEIAADIRAEAE